MNPPRKQFTLGELMGLVALCALGFALLTTPLRLAGRGQCWSSSRASYWKKSGVARGSSAVSSPAA